MSPTFPLLPQGAVPTARTWGAFFSGKEPAPHPGRKAPGRFDFALDPQRHKGRGLRPSPFGNPLPGTGDGGEAPAFGNPSRSWTGERQRKEKQRVSYLHPEASCDYQHGVQDLISSAPRPCYAGTDKSLGRTVENRIPQTCACCKFGQKRLFSSTVHGAFSFPQEEKRMGGVFQ